MLLFLELRWDVFGLWRCLGGARWVRVVLSNLQWGCGGNRWPEKGGKARQMVAVSELKQNKGREGEMRGFGRVSE